ncbi:hypothetical protein Ocin01_09468 [Orchesella cincta]|uniref:Uncharacterized protein n=1 Tax=Orchesella cincta TaxID=48709 RepID=A0A1D2MVV6_ORCCI|nr:hypothetical protein Ocin01_09468 [Orchesella cincta]
MMAVTHPSAYSQAPSSVHNFMNNGGVFMHSNPPKPLMSSSSSTSSTQNTAIRNWVKSGDVDKLENIVLEGQGARLLGMTDSASDMKVKTFLRSIPGYMAKVDLIHDAVIRGSVRELNTLLDKKKLSLARDAVGRGLAHTRPCSIHKRTCSSGSEKSTPKPFRFEIT